MGLTETDVIGDNINLFQKMRIDGLTGRRYFSKTDAKKGDHIEFYAEIDLLISVSVCPDGDSSLIRRVSTSSQSLSRSMTLVSSQRSSQSGRTGAPTGREAGMRRDHSDLC